MHSIIDNQQLYNFAKKCIKLKRQLSVGTSTLTPLNFYHELEKFFASKIYNPQFVYPERDLSLHSRIPALYEELSTIAMPTELRTYIEEFLADLSLIGKAAKAIGTYEFPYFAKSLYAQEFADLDLVVNATEKLPYHTGGSKKILNAKQIAERFTDVLHKKYGITDFSVLVDSYNDHIIRVGLKGAIIGSRVKRYESNVERLIVHEIETHALQSYNIKTAHNPLLRLLKHAESLIYCEGIAVYNEYITNNLTKEAFEQYFNRLKAIQMLNLSFRDLFDYLTLTFPPHKAFLTAARVKRGMGNTRAPGGFPKDASYLVGFQRIREYIEHGSNLSFLYIGKVPHLTSMLLRHNLLEEESMILPDFLYSRPQINSFSY